MCVLSEGILLLWNTVLSKDVMDGYRLAIRQCAGLLFSCGVHTYIHTYISYGCHCRVDGIVLHGRVHELGETSEEESKF